MNTITAYLIDSLLPKADAKSVAKISYMYGGSLKEDLADSIYFWYKTLAEAIEKGDEERFNSNLNHGLWIGSLTGKYDLDEDITGQLIKAREWDKYDRSLSRCCYSRTKTTIRAVKIVRATGQYRPTLAQLKEAEKRYNSEKK